MIRKNNTVAKSSKFGYISIDHVNFFMCLYVKEQIDFSHIAICLNDVFY